MRDKDLANAVIWILILATVIICVGMLMAMGEPEGAGWLHYN